MPRRNNRGGASLKLDSIWMGKAEPFRIERQSRENHSRLNCNGFALRGAERFGGSTLATEDS
jgi:hypothetical protein